MKFNVNDYPGDYVMFCDSSDEAAEFAEVLNAQGRTLRGGISYLELLSVKGARGFFFNEGLWVPSVDETAITSCYPRCRILHWKDFSHEVPDVLLKFEDIFGGDST